VAARTSLRDYQRELAARLQSAASGRAATKLGMQVGAESWLVDLADAGEVIPVPPIAPVPLTRPWFRGVANIRGKLYSVVDFPAFLGGAAVALGEQARLLLLSERYRMSGALLVDRLAGLRGSDQLRSQADGAGEAAARPAFAPTRWLDAAGRSWQAIDLGALARDVRFLSIAA